MVTNIVKEEFKDIESHDGGSLNLRLYGIPSRQEKDFTGQEGDFFLTFGFKDVFCSGPAKLGQSFAEMQVTADFVR